MIDSLFIELTQFEKTGSRGKTFISLENLIINFHFRNYKSITFFVTFTLCCLIEEFALFLHRGKAALRKHLLERDQKAALSSDVRKSRNKPRICKHSRLSKNSN